MKTGIVASTFDLLHAGHVIMLKEAKGVCDHLIAALQTDPTIDRPEKNRPVQSVFERFVQLEGCQYVDEIVVYATEQDLIDILLSYPINIRILGEEYKYKDFTGKEECEQRKIDIYYNRRDHSFSSTSLRQRIADAEAAKAINTENPFQELTSARLASEVANKTKDEETFNVSER